VGNGQYYQTCRSHSDAGKEHLAARHVSLDAKSRETYLDERECPSPRCGCCQGKHRSPYRPLEYGITCRFHLVAILKQTVCKDNDFAAFVKYLRQGLKVKKD
jgi:hypothetical protein